MYPVYYPFFYRSDMPNHFCCYTFPNMLQGFYPEMGEGYLPPFEPMDIEEDDLEQGLMESRPAWEDEPMRRWRDDCREDQVEEPVLDSDGPTHLHEVPMMDDMDMMQHEMMSPHEILAMIERHHPDMLKTLTDRGMSLDDARNFVGRIITMSLHHAR